MKKGLLEESKKSDRNSMILNDATRELSELILKIEGNYVEPSSNESGLTGNISFLENAPHHINLSSEDQNYSILKVIEKSNDKIEKLNELLT